MRTFNLTCEAVEATLPDYLDETLEPWVRTAIEEHLGECAHCTALARELRNIVREGAALPALLPERDVWPGIAGRIGAPVIGSEPVAESEPPPVATERVVWASDAFPPISEAAEVAIEPPTAASESPVLPIEPHVAMSDTPEVTSEPHVMMGDTAEVTSEPHVMMGDAPELTSEPPLMTSEPPVVITEPLVTSEPVLTTEAPPVYRELSPPTSAPLALVSEAPRPSGTVPVPAIASASALHARREKFWTRERMGLAAAALVLVTAGATFLLTSHWLGPARTQNVATDTGAQRLSSNQRSPTAPGTRGRVAGRGQLSDSSTLLPPPDQLGSALTVSAASAAPVNPSPEQVVYTKEINTLQRIVRRQKGELDTSTVTVIDKNLRTLDSAIGQIRAALKKDPGSSLLDGQASHALEMKVELLRRAAMMRSST
jgi:hypothetical protein